MNFDEFRQASKRTMRFEPEHRTNAALGLVGELGEYCTPPSNQDEEAGDALFYHGWLCEFYNIVPIAKRNQYDYHAVDAMYSAAAIADMIKKEVFHNKPMDREVLADHLSDIYSYFVGKYGDKLSNIYQANIAKLLLRHPIEKGYTNEGQNARADEVIKQCNPCNCDQGGTIQYEYDILPDEHILKCSYCNFTVIYRDLKRAIENWNSINIDVPVVDEHDTAYYNQAWTIATGGNAEQIAADYEAHIFGQTFGQVQDDLLAAMKAQTQTALNALYGLLVKKTADELPDIHESVLIWVNDCWTYAWRNANDEWENHTDYLPIEDGQYWLPMPTFNPESEG